MADRSAIEWCDSTFNPWTGCTKVSPACDHCYAESWSKRAGTKVGQWGHGAPRVRTTSANWKKPLQWDRRPFYHCDACGYRGESIIGTERGHQCPQCSHEPGADMLARRRVFCASLADVFDNEVDPQWRADLFALIHDTEHLDWLLLTKRIGNAEQMLEAAILGLRASGRVIRPWPWPNVWLGATICNQAEADRDIPKLLATPARARFVSIEPMLGAIDLRRAFFGYCPTHDFPGGFCLQREHKGVRHVDWVIAGGESGAHARPSHPDWFRALRDQCAAAGVPFLFKQWGEWLSADQDECMGMPDTRFMYADGSAYEHGHQRGMQLYGRVGKKAAGRTLDGRTHDGFPA